MKARFSFVLALFFSLVGAASAFAQAPDMELPTVATGDITGILGQLLSWTPISLLIWSAVAATILFLVVRGIIWAVAR